MCVDWILKVLDQEEKNNFIFIWVELINMGILEILESVYWL